MLNYIVRAREVIAIWLGMGRYRYQILDTFDTSAWKESIDTGKKYRYFDTPSLRYRSIVVSGFIIEIARRW